MYMCLHMSFNFEIVLLIFFYFSFYLFNIFFMAKNTDCMLLNKYKLKVSISDSLLLPPFSNQVVK